MISKPLVLGLLVATCITAAAGGAYVAIRQNDAGRLTAEPVPAATTAGKPVTESEAVVAPPTTRPSGTPEATLAPEKATPASRMERPAAAAEARTAKKDARDAGRTSTAAATRESARPSQTVATDLPAAGQPQPTREPQSTPVAALPAPTPAETAASVPAPVRPQFIEVVVPASSVVGLQVETSVSSETARVEDRVEARVTRDVMADGQVALPAGSKVIGNVTVVERGGKLKDKARLGVRFHTVVLADGNQVALRTDSIYREGASPGNESARKIGGAAIGGAILGAIIGGAKGAAIGSATGAAGGGAVVMAGDRNAAALAAGTIVNVRLSSPVTVDVEKEQ